MRHRLLELSLIMGLLTATAVVGAASAAPYYEGKRLTVLINYAPGGPTDIEGRLFAKHIAKHIDGHPDIIVQNMPGAGGIIGTNYLGKLAPKDGTMVGYFTGSAWNAVSHPEKYPVPFRTFDFIAFEPGTSIYYVRTDVKPGMKKPTDLAHAKGLVAGGLTAASPKDLRLRMTLDMLGIPYKYATGYGSNHPARLAFERGEINFFVESPPGYRSAVVPNLVEPGIAIPVYYDTAYNGEKYIVPKQVEGLSIQPFQEIYKKIKGRMPSGKLWDAYLSVMTVNAAMQRVIVLPPKSSDTAVKALRTAVARLNDDEDFARDAKAAVGFAPDYETGPNVNKRVRRALSVKPEAMAFINKYTGQH